MTEIKSTKQYDLEERTFCFARDMIEFTTTPSRTMSNVEIARQVIRSSGSVGANYIEANEALSKKDFAMRIKICRKEAKESKYWLRLVQIKEDSTEKRRQGLINEATELVKIFSSIVEKTK